MADGWQLTQGGVAQLGERLLCKQEVIGSIPFTSTKISCRLSAVSRQLDKGADRRSGEAEFAAGHRPGRRAGVAR